LQLARGSPSRLRAVYANAVAAGARAGRSDRAVIFLIVSLIAGAFGLTNVSQVAKRVSMVLFAMFFVVFLALMGFAYSASEAYLNMPTLAVTAIRHSQPLLRAFVPALLHPP
jgi:uncharacterized membrane protein YtjA (UPF0391 family)